MSKYYYFNLTNDIDKSLWENTISGCFFDVTKINWLTKNKGYIVSETNINHSISEILPMLSSDLTCQITFMTSHSNDYFSEYCRDYIFDNSSGKLFNLSNVVLHALINKNEFIIEAFNNYFSKVDKELLYDIKTYLNCDGSGIVAASKLYIHRNTWLLRIKKFERITGLNLDDYDDLSFVQLWFNYQRIK